MPLSRRMVRTWPVAFMLVASVLLVLASSLPAQAQGLSLSGLAGGGGGGDGEQQDQVDPQALEASLDQVIATLEDDAQRGELLARLKEMRQAT